MITRVAVLILLLAAMPSDAQPEREPITVENANHLALLVELEHPRPVNGIFFSRDSQTLYTTSRDEVLRLWDMTGDVGTSVESSNGFGGKALLSPDGRTLAYVLLEENSMETFLLEKTIRLWDLEESVFLGSIVGHTLPIESMAFNHDGTILYSSAIDGIVRLWDVHDMHELQAIGLGNLSSLRPPGVTISPNMRFLAVADADAIVLWDIENEQQIARVSIDNPYQMFTFSPDSTTLLSYNDAPKLFRIADNTERRLSDTHFVSGGFMAFSPDASIIVAGGRLWDTATGERLAIIGQENNITFSPDGTLLAAFEDRTARIWGIDPDFAAREIICAVVALNSANVRIEPILSSLPMRTIDAARLEDVIGYRMGNSGYRWWLLADGGWVREDIVHEEGACDSTSPM